LDVRLAEFQHRFDGIMAHHIDDEIEKIEKHIESSIRSYVTFVQLEKKRLQEMRSSVEEVKADINNIKSQI
jgi:archaellum component FlaC